MGEVGGRDVITARHGWTKAIGGEEGGGTFWVRRAGEKVHALSRGELHGVAEVVVGIENFTRLLVRYSWSEIEPV